MDYIFRGFYFMENVKYFIVNLRALSGWKGVQNTEKRLYMPVLHCLFRNFALQKLGLKTFSISTDFWIIWTIAMPLMKATTFH